jgi:hypothetical protein
MFPPTYPAYPPVLLIVGMFAVQAGFGFAFNWFFRWVHLQDAIAVVIGTFCTGAIMYPFFLVI